MLLVQDSKAADMDLSPDEDVAGALVVIDKVRNAIRLGLATACVDGQTEVVCQRSNGVESTDTLAIYI
jgi:hypothetical protein